MSDADVTADVTDDDVTDDVTIVVRFPEFNDVIDDVIDDVTLVVRRLPGQSDGRSTLPLRHEAVAVLDEGVLGERLGEGVCDLVRGVAVNDVDVAVRDKFADAVVADQDVFRLLCGDLFGHGFGGGVVLVKDFFFSFTSLSRARRKIICPGDPVPDTMYTTNVYQYPDTVKESVFVCNFSFKV